MILSKNSTIRSHFGSIVDVGDYYVVNGQVATKGLISNMAAYGDWRLASANPKINGVSDYLYEDNTSYSGKKPIINKSLKLKPYFDSTLGVTAGKRLAVSFNGSNDSYVSLFIIKGDGSVENQGPFFDSYENGATKVCVYPTSSESYIFAESLDWLYVTGEKNDTTEQYNANATKIFRINKQSKAVELIITDAKPSSNGYYTYDFRLIYEGIIGENAIFTAASPLSCGEAPYADSFGYLSVSLADGIATFKGYKHSVPGLEGKGSYNHSQLVEAPWNTSKVAYFMATLKTASDTVGTTLSIAKFQFNKNAALTDDVTKANNLTYLSLSGTPEDFIYGFTNFYFTNKVETNAFTHNGNVYLAVIRYCRRYNPSNAIPQPKLWLLKVSADGNSATFIQNITLDKQYTSAMMVIDGKTLCLSKTQDGFKLMKFVGDSESFESSEYYNAQGLRWISVSNDGIIYAGRKDGVMNDFYPFKSQAIDIVSVNDSAYTTVAFENNVESLQFTGSTVEQNVLLNSFDMYGNRVAKTVKVYLEGAVFKIGGGTLQQFTTSEGADTVIPIQISSTGVVTVTPELV